MNDIEKILGLLKSTDKSNQILGLEFANNYNLEKEFWEPLRQAYVFTNGGLYEHEKYPDRNILKDFFLNTTRLSLQYIYPCWDLTEIPKGISLLTNVDTILLINIELIKLEPSIFSLPKLNYLNLCSTTISEIPPEIKNAKNLKFLSIENTNIKTLPEEITELHELEDLRFGPYYDPHLNKGYILDKLPDIIFNLTSLKTLSLKNISIGAISKEIKNLKKLEYLAINDCFVDHLPKEILELTELEILNLNGNHLKKIPLDIFRCLGKLQEVDLSDNMFSSVYNKTIYNEGYLVPELIL